MWSKKVGWIIDVAISSIFFLIWVFSSMVAVWAAMWGDKQSSVYFMVIALVSLVPYFFFSDREKFKKDCTHIKGATPNYNYYISKHKSLQ